MDLTGRTLVILFNNDMALLCPEVALDFTQVELPEIARKKGFAHNVCWEIKVLGHDKERNQLFVDVLKYATGQEVFPVYQEELFDELIMIDKVVFRKIDTAMLLRSLNLGYLPSHAPNPAGFKSYHLDDEHQMNLGEPENPREKTPEDDGKVVLEETLVVPLKDVRFKLGGVSVHRKIQGYPDWIGFDIVNYDIREEFDAVKNYFARVLQTKKIVVQVKVELTNGEITDKSARSPQIEQINQKLIDSVKFEFVKKTLKKKVKTEVDKSLFTMDEYFDTYADQKARGSAFFTDENDLLDNLLQITHTKHYKNLRYLSSQHAHHIMKLRFVHKPFSFVFLIEGECNYHVVWETLDTTEATYIWHVDKNISALKMALRKIEDIINVVKVQGKTAYINADHDEPFRRIFHDYSDIVEGFVRWKGELDSVLT